MLQYFLKLHLDNIRRIEMAKSTFEYVDVTVIDEELKCVICFRPFHLPVSNSHCGHTFCEECLTEWYENSSNCPTCRQNVTLKDFQPVTSRAVINQLSRFNLKCNLCEEVNISDRQRHIQACPKQIAECSSVDIHCPWQGERQALPAHLETCSFQQVRPIIDRLIEAIETLKKTQDAQNRFIRGLINDGYILSKVCSQAECLITNSVTKNRKFSMPCFMCKKQTFSHLIALHSCEAVTCICQSCLKTYTQEQDRSLQLDLFPSQETGDNNQRRNSPRQRSRSRSRSPVRRRSRSRSPL